MQGLYNYFNNLSTFAKTLKKISTCFVFFYRLTKCKVRSEENAEKLYNNSNDECGAP